jgi:parallel beta-helix repeat protein
MPSNNIIYVDDDGGADYTKIQDAINNSSNGDTIYVYNGIYTENLIIDKTISLIGEDKVSTFIIDDFSQSSAAINININDVSVSNFTIIGEAVSYGIEINSDYAKISNNNIMSSIGVNINSGNNSIIENYIEADTFWGIGVHWYKGSFNNISNNIIISEGSGIYLIYLCKNNSIISNNITSRRYGIGLVESNGNIIVNNRMQKGGLLLLDSYDNIVFNNSVNGKSICYLQDESNYIINQDYGQIVLINCENITVEKQYIYDLQMGILLYNSKNCKIQNNIITHNDPFIGDGIIVFHSENIKILNNTLSYLDAINIYYSNNTIISYNNILNCRTGITIEYCNKCEISKNNIVNNSLCIDFQFGSRNSIVTMNNLMENTPNGKFIDPINANNTWYNNYWGRPRIFPKPIRGALIIKDEYPFPSLILWLKFDWNPASEPYDISSNGVKT